MMRSRPHPAFFKKGTRAYREAVRHFFELSVEPPTTSLAGCKTGDEAIYEDWLRSYSLYGDKPASWNEDTFETLDHIQECKQRRTVKSYKDVGALDQYIEPTSFITSDLEVSSMVTISELRNTYSNLCNAVAEIELSASTLRSNSRALTLAKKLVTEDAFEIFKILEDFEPRPRPKIAMAVEARLNRWATTKEREWNIDLNYVRRMKEFVCSELSTKRRRERAQEWAHLRSETLNKANAATWNQSREDGRGIRRAEVWEKARKEAEMEMKEVEGFGIIELTPSPNDFLQHLYDQIVSAWHRDWERARLWDQKKGFGDPLGSQLSWSTARVYWSKWARRMKDERDWIEDDRKAHPEAWNEDEWRRIMFWRDETEEWEKRGDEKMDVIDELADTSMQLINELKKIDGSTPANGLNIFSQEDEERYFVEDRIFQMKFEMMLGDKIGFIRHSNDLFESIEKRLRSNALKQGFDALNKKQDHYRNTFMDFATVAIFFSSITATTLQYSFAVDDHSVLSTLVNACWLASLVLSIASATNSFLGAIVHRSPEYLRPSANPRSQFFQTWFKFIPPVLLLISGLLFLLGICAFTLVPASSFPGTIIEYVTIGLTSANALALAILILLAFTRVFENIAVPTFNFLFSIARFTIQVSILSLCLLMICLLALLHFLYGLVRFCTFSMDHESWFQATYVNTSKSLETVTDWCEGGLKDFFEDAREVLRRSVPLLRGVSEITEKVVRIFDPRSTTNYPGVSQMSSPAP